VSDVCAVAKVLMSQKKEGPFSGPVDNLKCPDCGAPMVLRDSKYGLFYGCATFPECRSTHGAHEDGTPLGIPGTKEVKLARIAAHSAFDELWKSGSMPRRKAYRWMAHAMELTGEESHIGRFDEEQCKKLIEKVQEELDKCQ